MSRVTINEIARRSGVSKGAVSYALNNRPGVSAEARARILAVADQLGWAPNRTARLLSGSRTDSFGLVLARDPRTLASEPFYMEFVAGLESVLSTRSYALLLQVCVDLDSELATYRKWSSERRVDAVVVVDVRVDDPRLPLLTELELPALFVGDPSVTDSFTTCRSGTGPSSPPPPRAAPPAGSTSPTSRPRGVATPPAPCSRGRAPPPRSCSTTT